MGNEDEFSPERVHTIVIGSEWHRGAKKAMADGQEKIDEILGIDRCARCGHRLDGEIECPFCSLFPEPPRKHVIPGWVFIIACFLTSPISIYFVLKSDRLKMTAKILTASGCLFWLALYRLWF